MLTIDDAMPLMLFAIEAISNAYRHAFDEETNGQITVRLRSESGMGHLEVRDDGRGFVDAENPTNVGMELMQAFASQLDGEMKVEPSDEGVAVCLSFALD